jgi:hypothetical protein
MWNALSRNPELFQPPNTRPQHDLTLLSLLCASRSWKSLGLSQVEVASRKSVSWIDFRKFERMDRETDSYQTSEGVKKDIY